MSPALGKIHGKSVPNSADAPHISGGVELEASPQEEIPPQLDEIRSTSDRELLDRFFAQKDETAFRLLVQRHGPMVHATCLRVLKNEADAEDAFQATFLILARKAEAVRGSAGGWLHRVAHRAAVELKMNEARHKQREKRAAAIPTNGAGQAAAWEQIEPILDEELAKLPDRYRLPLVLCYLEGKSRFEAAAELGCRESQLKGRLERGREALRSRLIGRGIPIGAGVLAGLLQHQTASTAAVSSVLIISTASAGTAAAAGAAIPAGVASAKAVAVTQAVLKTMHWALLKGVFATALTVGIVATSSLLAVEVVQKYSPPGKSTKIEAPVAYQQGFVVREYELHPNQPNDDFSKIDYRQFTQVVDQYMATSLSDFKRSKTRNAIATGFLKIDQPGAYDFMIQCHNGQGHLEINGQAIPISEGPGVFRSGRVTLPKGMVPIVCVDYLTYHGGRTAMIAVQWKLPGEQAMREIPTNLLFADASDANRVRQNGK